MSKKKQSSDIGKLVDAQAKGKKVRVKTDKKTPAGRDLDVRASKASDYYLKI